MEIVEVTRVVCGPYFPPDRGPREVSGGFGLRDRHAVPERLLRRDRELVPEADSLRACGGPQPRRRRTHHEGCRRKGVRQGSHHPAQHHQSPCRDAPRHFFSKFRSRQVTNRAASALLLCLARDMVEPGVHEEGQQHCSRCRPRSDRLSSRRTPRAVLSFPGHARLCSSLPVLTVWCGGCAALMRRASGPRTRHGFRLVCASHPLPPLRSWRSPGRARRPRVCAGGRGRARGMVVVM